MISSALLYVSEVMGLALRDAAYSPNIKERMDHSAAVFTADGKLLSQAEHIPVHLGSLPWGMKNLIEHCEREGIDFEDRSMVVSNDPYITGTHVNDVTVVAPVYYGRKLVAFVANKAHHSDVGGVVPGSISMKAKTLDEEGFVLEPQRLCKNGSFVEQVVEDFASKSRSPEERRGDLRAQTAADSAGVKRVGELLDKYGREAFELSAEDSFSHSDRLFGKRISQFSEGTYKASDVLEGPEGEDLLLRTRVRIENGRVEIDYSGTDRQVDYPLNAVLGVTISGAYFVFRALTGSDVAANYGAFRRIRVEAPEGSLLNPTRPHPVGAGNVETSQRNADVLFRALSRAAPRLVPAAAGGSMNNVMMGGDWRGGWSFYETIGVGLGGRAGADGIDGIQSNMTNTMNTPVEDIERSYPLMITKYEFRPDSSGAGINRGGSGLIRAYKCLGEGTTFTITADRERHLPWGLDAGRPGEGTRVYLKRKGKTTRLPVKCTFEMMKDDVVEIRTAGGGGHGSPTKRPESSIEKDLESGLLSPGRAIRDYGFRLQ